MDLSNLPVEIVPLIVQHLLRPQHLAQVCLVNKSFYLYTAPLLYERTAIFAWHKEGKKKATKLFWTLANCPQLARYVRKLELRDFPKAISRESAQELTATCVRAIENCSNLQSCTWTRDGSLKDDILEVLARCPRLEALEINGRHTRNYDPELLSKFSRLRKIAFIMPTNEVMQQLPLCLRNNQTTLQALTIICKFTSVVTDRSLQTLASALTYLKHIHIAGCPKISHHGIIDVLLANSSGIENIALEGVSPSFDMKALASFSLRSKAFARLQSITLAFPVSNYTSHWLVDVETLLWNSPLQSLRLYATGEQNSSPVSLEASFIRRFMQHHAKDLISLAVLRLPMSLYSLDYVVSNGEKLEQLFVSIWRSDLSKIGPIVAHSRTLRTLHVTYAYNAVEDEAEPDEADADDDADGDGDGLFGEIGANVPTSEFDVNRPLPSMDELEELASHFGENIKQFGVQTRVWQVERETVQKADSEFVTKVRLGQYESPDIPEVFLVMRT